MHDEVEPLIEERESHCIPYVASRRPVLISRETDVRTFGCRIRAESITWRLTAFDHIAIAPYDIARNVESVRLSRNDLPWSPQPYSVDLQMRVERDGIPSFVTWPLIVAPDPGSLFEVDIEPEVGP